MKASTKCWRSGDLKVWKSGGLAVWVRSLTFMTERVNVSCLDNEVLRPWTIDVLANERLREEMSALENTISITSPQKNAGRRGVSILDNQIPALVDFHKTVKQRAVANGYRTIYDSRQGIPSSSSSKPSGAASRASNRSDPTEPASRSPSSSDMPADEDDEDVRYISAVQRSIFTSSRHLREARPSTSMPSPIRYRAGSQPALLTAKKHASYLRIRQQLQEQEHK